MKLMPEWAQHLAAFLPFQWAFYYPIETLVGDLSTAELLGGLGMQALWIAIGSFLVWVCFRASVRHYTAVGN
jgi:ABC-2 type transport system permease protein